MIRITAIDWYALLNTVEEFPGMLKVYGPGLPATEVRRSEWLGWPAPSFRRLEVDRVLQRSE